MNFDRPPQVKAERKDLRTSIEDGMLVMVEVQNGLKELLADANKRMDLTTAAKLQKILDQSVEAERIINEDIGHYYDKQAGLAA